MAQLWMQGGWVLAAIAACSTLGWALAIWKWLRVRGEAERGEALGEAVLGRVREGRVAEALALCRERGGLVGRLLAAAFETHEPKRRWFERHLQPLLDAEREALRRHLGTVAVTAVLLPLLGLLGTVLGMQQTFAALQRVEVVEAERLAGGISQALVTTQAGLMTALPLLLLHGYLRSRVERALDMAALYVKRVETLRCKD